MPLPNDANSFRATGCIYCGADGPYTLEHVIPVAIGGDDMEWLLRDCVCGMCNTEILGKLETKVFRAGLIALTRIFLQEKTQRMGKSKQAPQYDGHFLHEHEGQWLHATLEAGGVPNILPQLQFSAQGFDTIIHMAGDASESIDLLRQKASALLANPIIVEKVRDGLEARFHVTQLDRSAESFVVGVMESISVAPRDAFWLQPRPQIPETSRAVGPSIFLHKGKSVVCCADSVDEAATLLTLARETSGQWLHRDLSTGIAVEGQVELVHSLPYYRRDSLRVLTKIGINIVARLWQDFVRATEFDEAVSFARDNVGLLQTMKNVPILPGKPGWHVFALHRVDRSADQVELALYCQLYGAAAECIRLACFKKDTWPASVSASVTILVDPRENRVHCEPDQLIRTTN